MDATKKLIMDTLDQIVSADLKRFIWHLWNGVGHDIDPIPRALLENVDRQDLVDIMVQRYTTNAGTVAVQVLCNINQHDLAKKLDLKLQQGKKKQFTLVYDIIAL